MIKYLIFTICVLIGSSMYANGIVNSKAFAQLPVGTNNNTAMTIHTTNSIQGSNLNVLKQEEPVIRKTILSNVDNAVFIAKGSVKSPIPVNVNAKIINQLTNTGVDTTQGIDMTKKLIAIELTDALNTITPNSISHRIAVDKQAICNGIASPTKASCSFTINLHS